MVTVDFNCDEETFMRVFEKSIVDKILITKFENKT